MKNYSFIVIENSLPFLLVLDCFYC